MGETSILFTEQPRDLAENQLGAPVFWRAIFVIIGSHRPRTACSVRVARQPPIADLAGMIHLEHGNMSIGFALFSIVYFVINASFPR